MKVVAVVPLKLNNERLPGKNTKCFDDGTPLITYFLKTLVKVSGFNEIYVFCSDSSICKYIIHPVKFVERPLYLDEKNATPQDIISEFMKRVDADIYAVCHCTSPFVTVSHFEECVNAVKNENHDSSFTGELIKKLLWNQDNVPLNFSANNVPRTQDLSDIYAENSACYVFSKSTFVKYKRRVGFTPHITVVKGVECVDIDYPEDFEIANAIYKSFFMGNR